jgi:hypothetical protein
VVIVAAVGQAILTTAGILSGWISSIVSVSAPLTGPEDRMVDWVTGTRFLHKWVSGPSGAAIFWRATSLVRLVDLGQPFTSDRLLDQLQASAGVQMLGNSWVDSSRRTRVRRGKVCGALTR